MKIIKIIIIVIVLMLAIIGAYYVMIKKDTFLQKNTIDQEEINYDFDFLEGRWLSDVEDDSRFEIVFKRITFESGILSGYSCITKELNCDDEQNAVLWVFETVDDKGYEFDVNNEIKALINTTNDQLDEISITFSLHNSKEELEASEFKNLMEKEIIFQKDSLYLSVQDSPSTVILEEPKVEGSDYIDVNNYRYKNAVSFGTPQLDSTRPNHALRKVSFGPLSLDFGGINTGLLNESFVIENPKGDKFECALGGIGTFDDTSRQNEEKISCFWTDENGNGYVIIQYESKALTNEFIQFLKSIEKVEN